MSNKKTKIINLIAGPGVGKTTMAAMIFVLLKIKKLTIEYVPEYAKQLVWTKDFEMLNNQHHVSLQQYKLFKYISGSVDYIITDGSLLHGLYYNRNNPDNLSNVEKTEDKIMEYFNDENFENINIFLERNSQVEYEKEGRIQTFDEAKIVDIELMKILDEKGIAYTKVTSELSNAETIINTIITK